jgi:hypothetical protein
MIPEDAINEKLFKLSKGECLGFNGYSCLTAVQLKNYLSVVTTEVYVNNLLVKVKPFTQFGLKLYPLYRVLDEIRKRKGRKLRARINRKSKKGHTNRKKVSMP